MMLQESPAVPAAWKRSRQRPSSSCMAFSISAMVGTKTFVPTIAEMLKAIQEEEGRWRDRFQAAGTAGDSCSIIDYLTDLAEEVLPKAKTKQAAEAEKTA